MHTAHLLTVSPNMHRARGVSAPRVVSAPGGCLLPGGVCSQGCLLLARGVVSQHALRQTPLWTEFLTHATENITLPQTSFAGGKNIRYMSLLYRESRNGVNRFLDVFKFAQIIEHNGFFQELYHTY